MPQYTFYDKEADFTFDVWMSIKEFEECGGKQPSPESGEACEVLPPRIHFKISSKVAIQPKLSTISLDTPKTLGSLAEKNSSKLGSTGVEERNQNYKTKMLKERKRNWEDYCRRHKVEIPHNDKHFMKESSPMPWRDSKQADLSLTKMTKEETVRYIETGKKPIGLKERKNGSNN